MEIQSALFVYGVYVHRDEIASDALIVLCNNVLSNGSTLPARLRTHRGINHTEYKDKGMINFSCASLPR